ncbi:hypothetical protein PoB_007683000 [Plakobranchus ocellatus]|uniref:CTCK domain-containing protein n=1 Tax=Plakobranchus ocellatus TaxID=259542 RepID=A0AAV4E1S6_9GAST|nr:hypothetical protein PoB_007683000 [Plakobranchus ocellatus]
MCGISECCIFPSFNVPFPASESAAVDQKRKQFRNLCFTKWAFIELLAEDESTLSLVFSKFAKLDAMEFKSVDTNIEERLQLEEELLQIAAFRLDRQAMPVHGKHRSIFRTISKLKSLHNQLDGSQHFRAHPIRDVKNSTRDRAASKVGVDLTSFRDEHDRRIRSVGRTGCNQLVYTRLYTISGCVPKSILLWRCQGTCDSRSVPEWDAASSMVASVENCNCCSAGLLKSRTTVFVCPNRRRGNITRTVTWPFRCSCRPCSSVPTIQRVG